MIVDTRQPIAMIKWVTLGSARIWYDEEWWVSMRIPFLQRTWKLTELMKKRSKKVVPGKKREKPQRLKKSRLIKKMLCVLKTFKIRQWKIAIDTGDPIRNAQLFPVNFFPGAGEHVIVNFYAENYLVLEISNRPLKMIIAFLRR